MTEATPDSSPSAASPAPAPAGAAAGSGEEIGYAEALTELEGILDELDGDEVDVDVLGARVRRAAELLRLCRARIAGARFEVEQVVSDLEAEAEAATAAAGVSADAPVADDDGGADEDGGDSDGRDP
ncbi:MAG TPA: exodeoxyribonuclease VII small subunit [Acidimicrobiales bacterium]|jgi:exodeoxyribonuclease VII small subunit|nr:exodeoxyribonuclease VII small subunit [Acidimicrobiales bacterium]